MSFFLVDRIRTGGKLYIAAVAVCGIPVFVYALATSIRNFDARWMGLAILCAIGSFFPVTISSKHGASESRTLTVGDVFVFSAIFLFGPEQAVAISVLDGCVSNIRARTNRFYKYVFNLAELSLVTLLAGKFFYALLGQQPPLDPHDLPGLAVFSASVAATGAVFYTLNSGAVALAIALATKQPLSRVWEKDFVWISLATVAGASLSALVFLTFKETHLLGVTFAAPIVLVVYYAYKINLHRIKEAERHASEVSTLYGSAIASLATAIDAKDQRTHGHVHRVQRLALGLARRCGFEDPPELEGLKAASLLHDIGKLAVPEYILNKPTTLTQWETQRMRMHPDVGADILSSVPFPYPVVPFVRCHHEKWDGTGYPQGLKGEEIPIGARILAIADCYDALRSERPYRPKLTTEATLDYIRSQSGKAYDPKLVEVLIRHAPALEREMGEAERTLPNTVIKSIEEHVAPTPTGRPGDVSTTLFQKAASTQREVLRVLEMSRAFGRSFNLTETLSILGGKIRDLVPYQACAIYLLDSSRDRIMPHHVDGDHKEALEQTNLAFGEGITGWVAANRQPLMNVSPSPDFTRNRFLSAVFKSCLAAPLFDRESTLGVITLYSTRQKAYKEDDLRLMEAISHYAVSVITNALIFEDQRPEVFTDTVTGLPNSRYFRIFAESELKRASSVDYPVSVLLLELDDLPNLTRSFGERTACRALAETAHILRGQIRKTDTCARRGNGFAAVLPGLDRLALQPAMERIRQALDEHRLHLETSGSVSLCGVMGFSTSPADGWALDSLLRQAERRMRQEAERRRFKPAEVLPFDRRERGQ